MDSPGVPHFNDDVLEDEQPMSSLMSLANKHLSKCLKNEQQSSLMSLASQHLSKFNLNSECDTAVSNMTFFIPKLRTDTEQQDDGTIPDIGGLIIKCETAPTEISTSFNFETAKEKIDNTVLDDKAPDDYIIDLSVALIKTNLNEPVIPLPNTKPIIPEKIIFLPPAELIKEIKIVTNRLPCLFNSPNIPRKKLFNKGSPMSRVICAKYTEREVLKIDHKYHDTFGKIKPFKFDTPSPDEIVLRNLKLKKPPPSWVEVFNKF